MVVNISTLLLLMFAIKLRILPVLLTNSPVANNYTIGHSYFFTISLVTVLSFIWEECHHHLLLLQSSTLPHLLMLLMPGGTYCGVISGRHGHPCRPSSGPRAT
mmetsp:Transcript_28853/g.42754  ORF Transcript_28853/g.42754 Transcript_28853/m.42754 type:complete len:103 (-) Transcript_28853:222-530(-)